MQPSTHINDFLGGLPRVEKKKVWKVIDENGNVVQGVGSTDNLESTAMKYIAQKYPGRNLTLVFSHYKGLVAVSR